MTTVGPELTSFIDPSLTWKTVSKGRNTSRRSRRSVSKNMKMVHEHEKRSPKRLNKLQCSETEKSNAMIHGRRFPGNMEHIPIKKRRLFLRSASPPLQSPNCLEDSEDLVGDHCTADQLTCSDVTTESPIMGVSFSEGSKSRNFDCDGNIDEKGVNSLNNDARGLGEDFSGIAILAAAACSDRLDYSTDDAGKCLSQMGLLNREKNESLVSAPDLKENIPSIQAPDFPGKDIKDVEGASVVGLPIDGIQVVSVSNDADDLGMSPIKEFQKAEQNDSVVSTALKKENIESLGLPASIRSDAAQENKDVDSPHEVADKTAKNSGATRDCRFHWDLNTVMDEWGNPLDDTDTDFASSTQVVEVTPMNTMESQIFEDAGGSEAKRFEIENVDVDGLEAKKFEATVSGDRVTFQAEVCVEPESRALPDNAGSTSVSTSVSRMGHCSDVSSGFVTSILKQKNSLSDVNNHVVESSVCVTVSEIQPKVVNEGATIDHSLSLGLNGTKALASEENIGAGSENLNEVAEEMQTVKSEEHEIGLLLAPLSGKALSVGKGADCNLIEESNIKNVVDENDRNVENVTCQSTANQSLGSKCEIATLYASDKAEVSCRVNDLNCPPKQNSLADSEVKHEESVGRSLESQPSSSENLMVESENLSVSHCPSNSVDRFATSMSMGDDQAINAVSAKEIEEKPTVTDVSGTDPLNNHGSEALVPKILDPCVAVDPCSKPTSGHVGGHGLHVSNEDLSQVTENAGTVTELEGGYDSHLEDGELRESHCWEDNEGEDGETEHVDYDSDNRDDFVFYEAANDSVQLSGEVLVGESEKQSYRSDNFSSADEQPKLDKRVEENCSVRIQGCLSTVDAVEAVCPKRDSALKACSAANNNSEKGEMDNKDCRSSIEADSVGKEFDCDPPRNARGASASGRDLQFSDRGADSMRRSRSSNFDCIHHTDGPDGSLNRSQQPPMRMGRFGGRSWNPELKSTVANSASEDDGERIIRASGDTPFRGRRPRIINTSRSGYHIMRRGSPGERGNDFGMGMIKAREFSPDNNPRSRFGRFNGINRGFREGGYRRPGVYEGPKSGGGGPMLNRFGKRDRSFSPVGGDRFHRKSRSRSRTRSPDFRSEARMGRGRLPYQQATHAGEHMRERSPVRVFNPNQRFDAIGSPGRMRSDDCMRPTMRPMRFHDTTSGRAHDFEESDDFRRKPLLMRNNRRSRSRSRSCSPNFRSDTRMGSMRVPYQPSGDHIRDRRSPPVRVFRPNQRYEGGGSPPVRLRSDECLRPIMRPLRFPDTAQPGRGHELNNNNNNSSNSNGDDFRRKPRNIFERIHPGRHYDVEGGDVRRFQYDSEEGAPPPTQNFRRHDNYGRAGERRPVEFRGPREERGNVRYNNNNNSDRMLYSGPKQFGGMRDYAEDGIPRRPRP